jgi:anti-sigma regulatory factor (Ser/Thr protein kinase)
VGHSAERHFSASLPDVVHARKFVEGTLATWERPRRDAGLLVTELAANAVLHARSDFTVTLAADTERIRITVADASPCLPVVRPRDAEREGGRGMWIVAAMSLAWGCEHADAGKRVWIEL